MSEETKNDSILPILPICGYDQDYEVNHISGIHDGTVKAPLLGEKKEIINKSNRGTHWEKISEFKRKMSNLRERQ